MAIDIINTPTVLAQRNIAWIASSNDSVDDIAIRTERVSWGTKGGVLTPFPPVSDFGELGMKNMGVSATVTIQPGDEK